MEPSYGVGEQVLAYHMNMLYDAKVLVVDQEERDGQLIPIYKIHYQGWKSRYDEFVDDSRLLKLNEANKEIQKEMKIALKKKREDARQKKKEGSAKKGGAKKGTPASSGKGGKGGRGRGRPAKSGKSASGGGTAGSAEPDIDFPQALKERLVFDHMQVNQQKSLTLLPSAMSVAAVLERFQEIKASDSSFPYQKEIVDGLQAYFDQALSRLLLYRFERPQYAELYKRDPDLPASKVYGCDHLLRLLAKMPELLSVAAVAEDTRDAVFLHVNELLKFIEVNANDFLLPTYARASDEYCSLVVH